LADGPLLHSRKRRSQISIIADVLEVAERGAYKTRIMYKTSLSHLLVNHYLSLLLNRNLLEAFKASGKTTYKTTEKGQRYLRGYREIMNLLKEEKINKPREANLLHLIECGTRVIIAR